MNVFSYKNYLEILQESLKSNQETRGFHGQLAKAADMHPSYLSRILHGSIHLTPDQAAGLCEFWKLNHDESQYFLTLVNWERAGSPLLKKRLAAELKNIKAQHEDLGAQLPAEKIDNLKENLYYSAWYFSAVHVLLTIPEFQTEVAIAGKLNLPMLQVRKILESLEQWQLVQKVKNKWEPTKNNVHLANHSWMSGFHHTNWRTKMCDKIQFQNPEDLHYTGVHSLSRNDFKKIKDLLTDALVNVDKTVRPSKEEELCCLVIDWAQI